jgi:hypothetical protein
MFNQLRLHRISTFIGASMLAVLSGGVAAEAQSEASHAMPMLVAIKITGEVCGVDLSTQQKEDLDAAISKTQSIAGTRPDQAAAMTTAMRSKMEADKIAGTFCTPEQKEGLEESLRQALIKVAAIKPPPPPDPVMKAQFRTAMLLDAISDECAIDLSDEDTEKLEAAQDFFRQKSGLNEMEAEEIQASIEKEAKQNKAKFCSSAFDFKKSFAEIVAAAK